ncbi:ABC-2 type transport system ATP-binding protein [Actinoplanes lutulentus]|uniref:ABC-2 type transport system ATP-binding protein n=1 Tax=Actinoplanes lutulentus TaxID=1287878 RepID=A0A327ZCG6_9ACTN|nr:alpha/beta fold hydrolase [Actinoplanes lutulentus]MBB2945783.1 ABC-2 type transport system ATP-binding protein [Actinoplanes lutulentus]RAK37832.1 ABC-2 type transport system ATP-binding protein [Actinoplanes lutulentus]
MSALSAGLRKLPRLTRRRAITASVVVVLLAAAAVWTVRSDRSDWTSEDLRLTVSSGPAGNEPVDLDARFYLPADRSGKVPAVLLAHGFGGTKNSVSSDAESLASRGYAVLTWTARGFGRSGGEIHLDSPDYEVKDAQGLLDWLATRPEVSTDAAGDPKVGVVGGSYGGALALLLAGQDQRVDAIVPSITWNDLNKSFLPQSAGTDATGVFKKSWAGLFFGNGAAGAESAVSAQLGGGSETAEGGVGGGAAALDPACGRFSAEVCAAYLQMATTGIPNAATTELLRKSSPATVLDKIKAPTLLVQGAVDTLFPLSEADANAKGIAATGTPVRVAWFTGGHDGGEGPTSDSDRVKYLTVQWLDHYLKGEGEVPGDDFTWSRVAGFSALDRGLVTNGYSAQAYPGMGGTGRTQISLTGSAQPIANPPNGNPGALSSLPGLGGRLSSVLSGGVAMDIPGQVATFTSEPLTAGVDVGGSPTLQLKAASPTGEATLFVKLYDVDQNGASTLSAGLVAPVRLTGLPADIATAAPITVTLPAIVRRIEAGHTVRIAVATSDQAFLTPAQPATYTVAVEPSLTLPTLVGTPIADPGTLWWYALAGVIAAILLGLTVVILVIRRRHRRRETSVIDGYAETPLVVDGLRKAYGDGFVAVQEIGFKVERGQVVGLLGPNGAGKTTTLRVLMGLTTPTAGEIYVFGHRLVPGAPILSRVGALVEGPGFLPHLTGYENLRAYWQATGRPWEDARFDEALEIAGLGDSVHRRTKNYSHGMRQRLAIAQAMLGLPELLVLDEPTDGLDPPQIAEMRRVLQRYATDGRAVLVSSHLLAEVEQTCTHAVVVNKGRIVASGLVDDIVGDSPSVQLDVSDVPAATRVLEELGVRSVTPEGTHGLIVDMNGTARSELVASLVTAGIGVDRLVPRRRLEDAFLALVGDNSRGSGDR